MVRSLKGKEWKLILGFLCVFPGSVLAVDIESQQSSNNAPDQPVAVESPPPSEEDDSGVRSRAPSSGSLQSPAMRQLQKVPIPRDAFIQMGPAPSNVTLTPVTPTIIRIEWSPSPGAVRYIISRNSASDFTVEANSGFFNPQNNRFGYGDLGRHPAMLHTYSVTAQFNPPLLPARSAPVQLVTPPALPPQNFKAMGTSIDPNNPQSRWNVMLSWTPRPEATSYRIVRRGINLPETILNASGGVSHVDQNLPPGEYIYKIYSVIRFANGEELLGAFSDSVTIQARPFNIIAIGDSVMWGQGLNDQNKFARKVANWLKGEIGKAVNLQNIARSGAITGTNVTGESPCPPDNQTCPDSSEVPWDHPTILYQARTLAPALVPQNEVDLVLVDGCANDVNMKSIINPFGHDENLRSDTRVYCNERMIGVLTEVANRFPRAKVAVTGYFPVISSRSNLGVLVPLWVAIGVVTLGAIPPDPFIGGMVAVGLQARAVTRSNIFYLESDSGLQSAVNLVNMSSRGRDRFRFAALPVGTDNSYGALNSWLWLIPAPPGVKDEVYDARWQACSRWPDDALADTICKQASLAHPNVAGAQAYTDAIKSVLTPFVPEWRTLHMATVKAPDDPLVVRVQPGPQEPNGGTMIVTASEGASGSPVPGTVMVNGWVAGTFGTQIRYEFRETNPTDIPVLLKIPNYLPGRFLTIPVRTLAVAVNVTNNGDPRTAVVTASDSVTGQLLNGMTTVQTPSSQVSGPTGQALTYPSCGSIPQDSQVIALGLVSGSGPVPCTGFVRVSGYPDASFDDLPGGITVHSIRDPNRPNLQRAPLK